MYPVNSDGFGMLGWIGGIASVAGGLLFFAGVLVVLYFLVRFLIIGTRAAELYVARHTPPRPAYVPVPEPRHEPTPAPTEERHPAPTPPPSPEPTPAPTPEPEAVRPTVVRHPTPEVAESAPPVRATSVRAPATGATLPVVKAPSKSRAPRGASTHAAPPEPPTIKAP